VALHDRVSIAGEGGRVTLDCRLHVMPPGAFTERFTVPVDPLIALTVIVELPEAPARI